MSDDYAEIEREGKLWRQKQKILCAVGFLVGFVCGLLASGVL